MEQKLFEEICNKHQLIKMSISKNPTFVSSDKQEGFEYILGKITSFWIKEGQRIYDQPASDKMQKIYMELNNAPKTEKETKESKVDNGKDKELVTQESILPDFLTSALMSKWAQMTTTDRILLFQKTPENKVKQVVVGKNNNGENQYAPYVEGNYMFKEANAAFLFDWYLSDIVISTCPTGVSVTGKLNVWFSEYNKYLSRPASGYQELNKRVDVEQAKKGATTDAIKKGLSLFGFNSDVYSGECI